LPSFEVPIIAVHLIDAPLFHLYNRYADLLSLQTLRHLAN